MNPFKKFNALGENDKIPTFLNATGHRSGGVAYNTKSGLQTRYPTRASKVRHALGTSIRQMSFFFSGSVLASIFVIKRSSLIAEPVLIVAGMLGIALLVLLYFSFPHYLYVIKQTASPILSAVLFITWALLVMLLALMVFGASR